METASHVGIANVRWQGKRSRHSRRMHNTQFYVSGKRPMRSIDAMKRMVLRIGPWEIWQKCKKKNVICKLSIQKSNLKLLSGECHWTSLMRSQLFFRWWLGAVKQPAITWANVDLILCRHMASLDHNHLRHTHIRLLKPIYLKVSPA